MISANPPADQELPSPDYAHVVVVECRGEHVPPRHRRRIYLSLAPAEKAVERAHVAGLSAKLSLYQLTPVRHG